MSKILVLSEKPEVGREYASALNCRDKKPGYIEGENYIITWAFGNLFTLKEPEDYNPEYKKWAFDVLPIIPEKFSIKLQNNDGVKKQFKVIKDLINRPDVSEILNGGDAGREGELIQRYILLAAGNKKPVKRIWLSSFTDKDIKDAFKNPKPSEEYDSIFKSAQARNELDWVFGLNLSRAYTTKFSEGVTISIGRCQTAVLNLIVERDLKIDKFIPEPYYELKSNFDVGYEGKYIKENSSKIDKKEEALKIKNSVEGKDGFIKEIKKEIKKKPHPQLNNLTSLQKIMNRKYGYTAQQVLDIMQNLYEKRKIASYPRTAAKVISESMVCELPTLLKNLCFGKFKEAAEYALNLEKLPVTKRLADDKGVTDHTAIIPTNNENIHSIYDQLSQEEINVFDEIAFSLLAVFQGDYKYESTSIITDINNNEFITKGIKVIEKGWKVLRQIDDNDNQEDDNELVLPDLKEGQNVTAIKVELIDKKTTPPPRYTEALILNDMENPSKLIGEDALKAAIKGHGIGTEATRAKIIETLFTRGYIERIKKEIHSTKLGRELIKIIDDEKIKSPELTAAWEEKLELIAQGKLRKDQFMEETINFVKEEIERLKNCNIETKLVKEQQTFGVCPICKHGTIKLSSKGWYCSDYKQGCKFFINKEIAGKTISETQAKKLISKGKTDIIKGFKGKTKQFDAYLVLKDQNIVFEFKKN